MPKKVERFVAGFVSIAFVFFLKPLFLFNRSSGLKEEFSL